MSAGQRSTTNKGIQTKLLNLASLRGAYDAYERCTKDRLRALGDQTEAATEKSELQRLCNFLESEIRDLDREREKLILGTPNLGERGTDEKQLSASAGQ